MDAPARARRLHLSNVVVSQLDTLVATAGALAVTPAVLHGLGDAAYGGWLLVNSFIGYMRLLDLGLSAGTVKFGAGAEARGDARDLSAVLDTSVFLFVCIGAVAAAVTIGLAHALPWLFATLGDDDRVAVLLLGFALAIDLAFRPFAAALRMRSLFFVYDGVELATYGVFKLGLVLYLAHLRVLSYRTLGLLTLGETVARVGVVAVLALVLSPALRRVRVRRPDGAIMKRLAGLGAGMTVIQVADVVRFQLDAAVLGLARPDSPESIAVFGLGARLPMIAYTTVGVIGAVLLPRFSGLSERGDERGRDELLASASLVTGLVSVFVMVNLAVFGPGFLALWLHKPWTHESGAVLLVLVPAYHLAILTGPSAGLLMGRGRLRGLVALTVVEAAANLALSVVLVRPLGVLGVALGTALPLAVIRGLGFPWLLRREIGLAPVVYARMHAPAMRAGGLYLLVVGGLSLVPLASYARFVLLATASAAAFVPVVVLTVPALRARVLLVVRRVQSSKRTRPLVSLR